MKRDVATFPTASPALKEDGSVIVRLKRFPAGLPYVVYVAHLREEPITTMFLTHLFHERRRHPQVDLRDWPW